ncbi:hypothetical protein Y1Q_0002596 [Alligator mississippiensis]|uniref:Uncharacterized protein n=1 Tax=Alligator mississippiensis TaxID=8496 RepID=A0A151NKN4_ALLMI|nr:hypothetical protein Y1Q_0002596 [Alligator mississippiensis]
MTIEMELRGDQPEAAGLKPAVKSPSKNSLKNALMNMIKIDSDNGKESIMLTCMWPLTWQVGQVRNSGFVPSAVPGAY